MNDDVGGASCNDSVKSRSSVSNSDSDDNVPPNNSMIGVDIGKQDPTMRGDGGTIDLILPLMVPGCNYIANRAVFRTSGSTGSSARISAGSNLQDLRNVAQRFTSPNASGASGSSSNVTNNMDKADTTSDRSSQFGFHSNQNIAVGQVLSQENVVNSLDGLESDDGLDSLSQAPPFIDIGTGGIHALARESFDDWATSNRNWIRIFVDEGLTLNVQDAIVTEIKAPTKVRQFRRNFENYTQFKAVDFLAYRKHMRLTAVAGSGQDDELECMLCTERGTVPDIVIFGYLPLLPRIKARVADEKSCSSIFTSYQNNCERSAALENNPNVQRLYEDVFDGELYRRIAIDCGGYEAVMYDVFIAPSTDGFRTFENGSYDCWPLAALNYNLDLTQRYLVNNIIPLGFLKGLDEPSHIDTWIIPLFEEVSSINRDGGTIIPFLMDRHIRSACMSFCRQVINRSLTSKRSVRA